MTGTFPQPTRSAIAPEPLNEAMAFYMVDSPEKSRKPMPGAAEAGIEEARLRQQAIGVKLRHMFDQVVNEPVPDEFLDILRRADQRDGGGER